MDLEAALFLPSPLTGRDEMVGRFYKNAVIPFDWTFYHEAGTSERGLTLANDKHGGIDAAVINFLMAFGGHGCILIHHADMDEHAHFMSLFWDFMKSAEFYQLNGRSRLFLADERWLRVWLDPLTKKLDKFVLRELSFDPRG